MYIKDVKTFREGYSFHFLVLQEFQVDPIAVFTAIFDKNAKNPFLPFNPHNVEPAPVPWFVGLPSLAGLIRSAGNI